MRSFGGTVMDELYWGKEHDSSYAWSVDMPFGGVHYTYKNYTFRVRAVAPVPVASAR